MSPTIRVFRVPFLVCLLWLPACFFGPAAVTRVSTFPVDQAKPDGELAPVLAQVPELVSQYKREEYSTAFHEDWPYEIVKVASAHDAWEVIKDPDSGLTQHRRLYVFYGLRSKTNPVECEVRGSWVAQKWQWAARTWGDTSLWDVPYEAKHAVYYNQNGVIPCETLVETLSLTTAP